MDTPEKKTLPSSSLLSKFEDSPVFTYISSLSPIKPLNLSHSGHSFHLLNFASPQSLQTPPPTSSVEESKITSVSHVSDVSKNNCSQNDGECRISGTLQPVDLNIKEIGKFDSGGEVIVNATNESLKYDGKSSESNTVHCDVEKPHYEFSVPSTEISPGEVIQYTSKEANSSTENAVSVQGIQMEENKELCDWEKFIYETSDMLSCHSPTNGEHHEELDDKSVDSESLSFVTTVLQPPNENVDDTQKVEFVSPLMYSQSHDMEVPLTKLAVGKLNETSQVPAVKTRAVLSEEVVHYSSTEIDDKSCSQKQKTTRRRCLVYEMSGAHYRKLLHDPEGNSPISDPSDIPRTLNEKCSVTGSNKVSSLLPGIGLHLNALAATSKDKIIVKRHTWTCRKQLISSPSTMSSLGSTDTKHLNTPTTSDLAREDCNRQKDGIEVTANACENSTVLDGIEFDQSSPKKKRKKSENVGETDSCKRCNCKRSKCLKLYCECFAAGLYCVEPCNCQDCFNKPIHEETVLETRRQIESRNPLAFAPKVIKSSGTLLNGDELNKTPASARHKRGCNCKKSGCLKKYCECFQGGVGCSLGCRCEGCKNTFGRKEGTEGIIFQETQILEKNEVSERDEENQDRPMPKPLEIRQPVRRPFHLGCIAPQFPSLSGGQSLKPCGTPKFDESNQTAFEEDLKTEPEDEALEVSKGDDYLLPNCVKSTSPNSKRVSPPHCDFETSPGWKSCRKLILRSIPTVTPQKDSMKLQGNLQ